MPNRFDLLPRGVNVSDLGTRNENTSAVNLKASPTANSPEQSKRGKTRKRKNKPSTHSTCTNRSIASGEPYENSIPPNSPFVYCDRLKPKGFQNVRNSCYLNASLQFLLHTPALLRILHPLRSEMIAEQLNQTTYLSEGSKEHYTVLHHILDLVGQFLPVSLPKYKSNPTAKNKLPSKGSSSNLSSFVSESTPSNQFAGIQSYPLDGTLVPNFGLLQKLDFDQGVQEDGAECLTRLLCRLHEDVARISKSNPSQSASISSPSEKDNSSEWVVIDRSGKRHPEAKKIELDGGHTVVSDLFSGVLITRSYMKHRNSSSTQCVDVQTRNATCRSTKEPFFILPLELESDEVSTIEGALARLVIGENVQGYRDQRTGLPSILERRIYLDKPPPYLLLQLKRFSYGPGSSVKSACPNSWSITKSMKLMRIPLNIVISPSLLNKEQKVTLSDRSYRLHAVIFHIGHRAQSGHYTAAIRWDDEINPPSSVVNHGCDAYFYVDDTSACVIRGSKLLHQLLQTHHPLDVELLKFHTATCSDSNVHETGVKHQPRTPYIIVYESLTQVASTAASFSSPMV